MWTTLCLQNNSKVNAEYVVSMDTQETTADREQQATQAIKWIVTQSSHAPSVARPDMQLMTAGQKLSAKYVEEWDMMNRGAGTILSVKSVVRMGIQLLDAGE